MLKALLIGNIGGDPVMQYTPAGQAVLRFNVASNYRAKGQSGEWEDRTEWVRVTLFGQRAEKLTQHLRKGQRVYVDGRLEARPWTDNQNQIRAGLELVANDVEFMGARADGAADRPAASGRTASGDSDDLDAIPF